MRRALGKGLAQLLGEQSEQQPTELALAAIRANPDQPRKNFDEEQLQELADSISEVGILQPILVRPLSEGQYEIVAGERRFRAAQMAGLAVVPVLVRAADDESTLQLALIENVQRVDISPLECALAYRELADRFEMRQEEIAIKVGKSRTAIANALRLLRLPDDIQEGLNDGIITEGHARAILQCEGEDAMKALFYRIVDHGMTVREAEREARRLPSEKTASKSPKTAEKSDPNMAAAEEALCEYFGTTVKIHTTGKGGRLSIDFYSAEDLQRIFELLELEL